MQACKRNRWQMALMWGATVASLLGFALSLRAQPAPVSSRTAPDGTEPMVDFPGCLWMRNTVGTDRAGLCVWTSCKHAADYQLVDALAGVRKWHESKPGGGWPERVDKDLAAICKEQGVSVPRYVNYYGADPEPIKLALRTGRLVCCTYSWSPTGRYGNARIAHMVNLAHWDDKWVCVIDNNPPLKPEWFKADQAPRALRGPDGKYWAVIFLAPPPPPPPHN